MPQIQTEENKNDYRARAENQQIYKVEQYERRRGSGSKVEKKHNQIKELSYIKYNYKNPIFGQNQRANNNSNNKQ